MKKKLKPDLLVVEAPDLFIGFDFATETFVPSLIPDTDVGLDTVELAGMFTAVVRAEVLAKISDPAIVETASVEAAWDALMGVEEAPSLVEMPSNILVASAPVVAVFPSPPYRERADLIEQIGRTEGGVIVAKLGRKAVSIIPNDLKTAAALKSFQVLDGLGTKYLNVEESLTAVAGAGSSCRLRFPLASVLDTPDTENCKLAQFLRSFGLTPFFAPSLANWIPKEIRRREREGTPFDLPAVQDNRPLYDRMEVGLVLKCKQAKGDFEEGAEYVVVETDALEDPEENEEADGNKAEKAAIGMKKRGAPDGGKAVYWGEMDGEMEAVFELETDA